ncbi:BCCT family transporter [Alkalicoccus saliphilus]|uniref:Glycine/betaine ABC transporter permease n=1 Tax=Alkalicoccus saliphilus TaxID=200989 RepID=A0A2T4U9B0_9BACI|nr:BCCT family transporter [Alkalicoccus saliphilus]PTL39970.1 glycine/betaine ABC transporter permease [Alkalicoccus saliphilus]
MSRKNHTTNLVFIVSVVITSVITLWGFLLPENMEAVMSSALETVIDTFGWFYVMTTAALVAFCLYLGFGPYRHVKLGKKNDKPEYSYYAWIGMLFAAGMGVGLVFWGVAEPMSHFVHPPDGIEPGTQAAAETGLLYGVFHWGIHPWSIYAAIALALAIAKFRKDLPGLISSTFYPLLSEKVRGPAGRWIDIIAVVSTVIGIATSLGLSTMQVGGGLSQVFGWDNNDFLHMVIIAVVTVIFLTSVLTGINKGMKYLSIGNLSLAGILLTGAILLGPTLFIMEHFTKTVGAYISSFVSLSFYTTPYSDNEWVGEWTFFYWAWLISWSPFVGTFIARVSKGRTVQEFIFGVLMVPTAVSALWFVTFGGTGLHLDLTTDTGLSPMIRETPEAGLFIVLETFPAGLLFSLMGLLLITVFFITSANSATYVLGVFSSGGDLNPPRKYLLVWGLMISSIAAALLLSGGIEGLQAMAITIALPFTLLMIFMMVSIHRALKEGYRADPIGVSEEEAEDASGNQH